MRLVDLVGLPDDVGVYAHVVKSFPIVKNKIVPDFLGLLKALLLDMLLPRIRLSSNGLKPADFNPGAGNQNREASASQNTGRSLT